MRSLSYEQVLCITWWHLRRVDNFRVLNGGIKQIEWDPLSLVAPGCLVYSYIYDYVVTILYQISFIPRLQCCTMNHGSFVNDQIVKCLVLMTELYFIFKCMYNPVSNTQYYFLLIFFSCEITICFLSIYRG